MPIVIHILRDVAALLVGRGALSREFIVARHLDVNGACMLMGKNFGDRSARAFVERGLTAATKETEAGADSAHTCTSAYLLGGEAINPIVIHVVGKVAARGALSRGFIVASHLGVNGAWMLMGKTLDRSARACIGTSHCGCCHRCLRNHTHLLAGKAFLIFVAEDIAVVLGGRRVPRSLVAAAHLYT